MFNFQFYSHQFQLTSHFLCWMGGSHRFFFWRRLPSYSHCWSVISISVHSHLWVCPFFSYPYSPSSPGMVVVVRQGCPLRCDGASSYMWKVCSQLEFLPPTTSPSTSSEMPNPLPCLPVSLYSTLIPETVAEASTADLPLTRSPVMLQSTLYNWFLSPYFSCLSLSR